MSYSCRFSVSRRFFYGGLDSPGFPRKTLEELSPGLVVFDSTTSAFAQRRSACPKILQAKLGTKLGSLRGMEKGAFGAHYFYQRL